MNTSNLNTTGISNASLSNCKRNYAKSWQKTASNFEDLHDISDVLEAINGIQPHYYYKDKFGIASRDLES